ncbi:MAG: hypothetical protein K6U11_00250 [bacterium]|nr:hypothetical protein [bacterium]
MRHFYLKRLAILLFSSLLIFCFSGCGGSKDSNFIITDTAGGSSDTGSAGNSGNNSADNTLPTPPTTVQQKPCSIEFVSAEPSTIALKDTGGPSRSEVSVLTFKVVDENRNPVADQTVNFELSTKVGDLSLSRQSAVSDSEGLVQVAVNAGNVPTHIRVWATLADDPSVATVSDELGISTGLPDQNSIALSAEVYNPEALDYIEDVPITFFAADHFNNFVPDGTVVYFTTEGGSIDPFCTIKQGACSVTWRSNGPIPKDGRVTILAHCIGEESFVNKNASGLFDPEDQFDPGTDLAEPYRDDNENGTYDLGEEFWDYNGNGIFDQKPNGIYNGSLCSKEAKDLGLCSEELVYTQTSIVLVMSGNVAEIKFWKPTAAGRILLDPNVDSVDLRNIKHYQDLLISLVDENNNPMPANTRVSVETTNGEIIGPNSFIVLSTNRRGPNYYSVRLKPTAGDGGWGMLTVEVTTPHGIVTLGCIEVVDEN